jgi:hypothetical protein
MAFFQQQRDKVIAPVALGLAMLVLLALALSGWAGGTCW